MLYIYIQNICYIYDYINYIYCLWLFSYSRADWDGLHAHLRDSHGRISLNSVLLLLNIYIHELCLSLSLSICLSVCLSVCLSLYIYAIYIVYINFINICYICIYKIYAISRYIYLYILYMYIYIYTYIYTI